jgi:putative transposase
LKDTKYQTMLGDADFIAQYKFGVAPEDTPEVSRTQRRTLALSLPEFQAMYPDLDEAMARAYLSTAFTIVQIGKYFGVAYRTVSGAVQPFEDSAKRAN